MTTTPLAPAPPVRRSWSGWRTLLVVVGALFAMVSVALFAIGGVGLWAQQQRDGAGYFTAGPERVTTSTYALSAPSLDVGGAGPDAFYTDDFLGDVRIDFESKTPGTAVFVGIGPAADVAAYLNGVGHDEVADFDVDPFKLSTTARAGGRAVRGTRRPVLLGRVRHGRRTQHPDLARDRRRLVRGDHERRRIAERRRRPERGRHRCPPSRASRSARSSAPSCC